MGHGPCIMYKGVTYIYLLKMVVFHPYLQYPEAFLDHGELCGIALQFQHLSIQETIWCNMAGMLPTRTFDKKNMF